MKILDQIKQAHQDKISKLFEEAGVFFAFDKRQFDEKRKEGVTYVQGFGGMLIPKGKEKEVYESLDRFVEEEQAELQSKVPMDEYIYHELADHECWYTGNFLSVLELVQGYYPQCTAEDIHAVYIKHINDFD